MRWISSSLGPMSWFRLASCSNWPCKKGDCMRGLGMYHKRTGIRRGLIRPLHACHRLKCGAPALCMALAAHWHSVWRCSCGGATGIPGSPKKDIGAPGSMLIGPCVTGVQRARPCNEQGCCGTSTRQEHLIVCNAQRRRMRTGDQSGA